MKKHILLIATLFIITSISFAQTDSIPHRFHQTDSSRIKEINEDKPNNEFNKTGNDEMINNNILNQKDQNDRNINEDGAPTSIDSDSTSTQKQVDDRQNGKIRQNGKTKQIRNGKMKAVEKDTM